MNIKTTSTRFVNLAYGQLPNGEWSHFSEERDPQGAPSRVGPVYRTKGEMLADTDRFANEVWCNGQTR